MKKLINFIIILILVFYVIVCVTVLPSAIKSERELVKKVDDIEQQIQNIQDNYVSYDDLQPVLDELYDLDQRLLPVEDDVKYYREVWREYFGIEVEKE
jgi:predicted PurR-regulated permease PerM